MVTYNIRSGTRSTHDSMKTRKYRRYSWYRINVVDDTVTGGAYSRPSQPSTRHPRPAQVTTASLPSIHSATPRMGAVMAASRPTENGLRRPCAAVGSRASGASRRRCRKRHAPSREPPRPGRHAPSSLRTPCKRGRVPASTTLSTPQPRSRVKTAALSASRCRRSACVSCGVS